MSTRCPAGTSGRIESRTRLGASRRRSQRTGHGPHRSSSPHRCRALKRRQLPTKVDDGRGRSAVLAAAHQGRGENRHPCCSHDDQNYRSHLPRPPPSPLSTMYNSTSQPMRLTDPPAARADSSSFRHRRSYANQHQSASSDFSRDFPAPGPGNTSHYRNNWLKEALAPPLPMAFVTTVTRSARSRCAFRFPRPDTRSVTWRYSTSVLNQPLGDTPPNDLRTSPTGRVRR